MPAWSALGAYIAATANYNGPELFVSLSRPRHAVKSDTINAVTTKFLAEHNLHDFTAHSTRGASVTVLILPGVDPHVVCAQIVLGPCTSIFFCGTPSGSGYRQVVE